MSRDVQGNGSLWGIPSLRSEGTYHLDVCERQIPNTAGTRCAKTNLTILSRWITTRGRGDLVTSLVAIPGDKEPGGYGEIYASAGSGEPPHGVTSYIGVYRDLVNGSNGNELPAQYRPLSGKAQPSDDYSDASLDFLRSTVDENYSRQVSAWADGGGQHGSSSVSASEVLRGMNLSLRQSGTGACASGDYPSSGEFGISTGVWVALNITNSGTVDRMVDVRLVASLGRGSDAQRSTAVGEIDAFVGDGPHFYYARDGPDGASHDLRILPPPGQSSTELPAGFTFANTTLLGPFVVTPGHHVVSLGGFSDGAIADLHDEAPSLFGNNACPSSDSLAFALAVAVEPVE
ncbi:MAG: hypothetical protein ACYDCK_15610 [Thermoplasmatota archaeon]